MRAAFEIDTVVESNEAYDNSNFLVFLKGGRKYSCKIKSLKNLKGVESEVSIVDFLEVNGFPVSKFLKTINGKEFLVLNNRIFCFYEVIEGSHFSGSVAECKGAAEFLAKMHSVGKTFNALNSVIFPDFTDFSNVILDLNKSKYEVIFEAIELVQGSNLNYSVLEKTLIHGDFHPGNLKFLNSKVSGVLDFDLSRVDSKAYDVAWAFRTFGAEADWKKTGGIDLALGLVFLKKYQQINALNPNEISLFPELLLCRYIILMHWLWKNDLNYETGVKCIKWLLTNAQRVKAFLKDNL